MVLKKELWIYCLVVATLLLFVGTMSSPLFSYNVWNDTNCFFTVGKSLFRGKVLYRDIFEQKGLYLYWLYGLTSFVSRNSFLGGYFLEVLFFTVFLAFMSKLLLYYMDEKYVLVFIPLMSVLILISSCFEKGGSAEELCLPFFMIFLCHCVEYLDNKGNGFTLLKSFADGALVAVVFWIKFNLVFMFIGGYVAFCLYFATQKKWKTLRNCIVMTAFGFMTASFPVFIYFWLNHALKDLYFGYFYANIFLYHEKVDFYDRLKSTIDYLKNYMRANSATCLFISLGLVGYFWRHRKKMRFGAFFLAFMLIMFILGSISIPVEVYDYYPLPLAVFAVFGFVELAELSKGRAAFSLRYSHVVVLVAFCMFIIFFSSNSYYLIGFPYEDLPQVKAAKIINQKENPTVLNYGCLDTGIYTIADVEPTCKFFCGLNLQNYQEMHDEQQRMIDKKKVDFVVTLTYTMEPDIFNGYEQVSCVEMPPISNGYYHLYRKID